MPFFWLVRLSCFESEIEDVLEWGECVNNRLLSSIVHPILRLVNIASDLFLFNGSCLGRTKTMRLCLASGSSKQL